MQISDSVRFAVVTTTIHKPLTLARWAECLTADDVIIVAGDVQTPHREVRKFLAGLHVPAVYLEPSEQSGWRVSEFIGWRSIQRRNIAVLEALRLRPKFITTVDDDNEPLEQSYFDDVAALLDPAEAETFQRVYRDDDVGFVNMCSPAYGSAVVHRGLPRVHHSHFKFTPPRSAMEATRLGVFQSLWKGHPDIDALDRVHNDVTVTPRGDWLAVAGDESWCPIDSQATTYRLEVAPLLCVWPHVGRADDIWGGYLARRVLDLLGWSVGYGAPFVNQDRGMYADDGARTHRTHMRELALEMFMYDNTELLCTILRNAVKQGPLHRDMLPRRAWTDRLLLPTGDVSLELLQTIGVMAATIGHVNAYASFLPVDTRRTLDAWTEDVIDALFGAPQVRTVNCE